MPKKTGASAGATPFCCTTNWKLKDPRGEDPALNVAILGKLRIDFSLEVFEEEAGAEENLLHHDEQASKSTLLALSSPKLTRKARKNGRKQRKSLAQSQNVNVKDREVDSRSRIKYLERELLGTLYGFESSTENLAVPDAACGSAAETFPETNSNVNWLCDGEEEISDDEDFYIESDLENVFNKYTTQLASLEGSSGRIKRKWKNDKSERLKRFCKKLEHPSQLSFEKRKNAKRAKFVACKREIQKNEHKNENAKNRKENIERKLREKNIVRRCPDWVPKHEDCQVEEKAASKPENYKNHKSKCSKRVERQIKKLRKHILTSSNAKKGLLQSGSAKKLVELQNREIKPEDFDVLIQLDLAEIRRRNSRKRKKNSGRNSTADFKLTANPVKYKNENNKLRNKSQADVKKISKYILQPCSAPKTAADDFVNKLMELQDREITPEDFDLLLQLDLSVATKTVSKSVVDNLSTDRYRIENNNIEQCTICMEDYEDGCVCKYLPCGHAFHSKCIRTWLTTTSTKCPIDNLEV